VLDKAQATASAPKPPVAPVDEISAAVPLPETPPVEALAAAPGIDAQSTAVVTPLTIPDVASQTTAVAEAPAVATQACRPGQPVLWPGTGATAAEWQPRLIGARPELNWAKAEHLLFLPCLDVTRPWQLRYQQGDGLLAVSGIAYRFRTVDQFLNELTRLRIGQHLAEALCARIVQVRYPAETSLRLYVDGHEKPHWTAQTMPCGRVAMLDRVMPCTHQVVVNDTQGYVLLIRDRPGDYHLSHELLTLDAEVERITGRRVELTVADREANSLALAQAYAASDHHHLLTLLDADQYHGVDDFAVVGTWTELPQHPGESGAAATWAKTADHPDDPRCFYLIRDDASGHLRAVYASTLGVDRLSAMAPSSTYRRRWNCQENPIKELVNGANLNKNYGYQQQPVPNRTALRQQAKRQERVAVTERQLATNQRHLARQHLRQEAQTARYRQRWQALQAQLTARRAELEQRQAADRPVRRALQQIARLEQHQETLTARHTQRLQRIQDQDVQPLLDRRTALEVELAQRQAAVAAVDVNRPMFERDLMKDQIMADWQSLLANLHHWSCDQYFPPAWQTLHLDTATKLIYNKPGRVVLTAERIDVILDPYEYQLDQQAAEAACGQFNARHIRDLAGRLIQIVVASFEHSIRRLRQLC